MYIVLSYYQQLSVLKIYGRVLWWLTTVSAFQFQMYFRGSGLIWKINCSWKPGTAYSSTDQPGALLQLLISFLEQLQGEWSEEWERGEGKRDDGGAWNAIPFSELSFPFLEPVCRGNEHSCLPNAHSKWTEALLPSAPLAGRPCVGCWKHWWLFPFIIF